MNILEKIKNWFKTPSVDSPAGTVNFTDKIVALKKVIYSKIGAIWTLINAFFGPEFFQHTAEFLFGVTMPKTSAMMIFLSLLMWGLGSICIYFAKLQERKFNGE